MKYLSLFTGIGGFELGITQAYETTRNIDVQKVRRGKEIKEGINEERGGLYAFSGEESLPAGDRHNELFDSSTDERQPNCVGYSEIDRYASSIYQKHFPNHKNYGDITKINEEDLPEFDLIVGGFPCQSFSIAGKRGGFSDTRGTLFFDIARIIKAKQPRLLLLENVKGLLSHDKGDTFRTIIRTLDELGYDVQWQVLNSKNFGVPQNRERVFIVGHLRGTARPKVFPFTENNSEDIVLPTITTRVTADSNGTYVGKRSPRQIIGSRSQGDRVYDPSGISVTLASQAGGLGAKTGLYAVKIKEATKKGYAEARPGQAINLAVPNSKTRRGRVSDVAQTLDTSMQQHTLTPDMKIRRLTPIECERLQGFPDNWTEGVSDTQRYKCCGNAVTTNVIQAIMEKLLD